MRNWTKTSLLLLSFWFMFYMSSEKLNQLETSTCELDLAWKLRAVCFQSSTLLVCIVTVLENISQKAENLMPNCLKIVYNHLTKGRVLNVRNCRKHNQQYILPCDNLLKLYSDILRTIKTSWNYSVCLFQGSFFLGWRVVLHLY